MDFSQIEQLWTSNGGDPGWAPFMAAVALAESGGNPQAKNDNASTGDYSIGLWQINYFGNLMASRTAQYGSPQSLQADPNAQAKAAIDLFGNNGAGIGNWKGDKAYNAWVAAGRPQKPSAATVNGWLSGAGVGTGTPGPNVTGGTTAASGAGVGCSSKGGGITIPSLGIVSSITGFGNINTGLGSACQIKALTGGLLVGAGGFIFLAGALLVASYGLSETRLGRQTARSIRQVPGVARAAGQARRAPQSARRVGTRGRGPTQRTTQPSSADEGLTEGREKERQAEEAFSDSAMEDYNRRSDAGETVPRNRRQAQRQGEAETARRGLSVVGPGDRRTGAERMRDAKKAA